MKKYYNKKWRFETWRECARCGFDFPLSALGRDPVHGLLVCDECSDDLGHSEYMRRLRIREGQNDTE